MNNSKFNIKNSKLFPHSEFSRNVLTLMTGTTIAQAIPIAISPILTRIYTPEDFGVFALSIIISFFISLITLIIVFVFNIQITNLLGNKEISNWLYFIPITVLLTGVYQSFNYWSNRKKQNIGFYTVIKNIKYIRGSINDTYSNF